ncbi:protein kinase [Acidobacteriota bacterium]
MTTHCPHCYFDNPDDTLYCGKCGKTLSPPESDPLSMTKTLETPEEALSAGAIFADRYQVIEKLGEGGMGKVYRARDIKLDEEVALKLLRPEIAADKNAIDRFSQELKIARKIVHKNIGRMYELMEAERLIFITMDYVAGEDLKSLIKRTEKITASKAIAIARQVCDGLTEAHNSGIVHRDLKPQNIMIDKAGNARIMDFGIARSIQAKEMTHEGAIIGTPQYMSPEQVEGKKADQRSDIYSLGVVLYEMVTGQVPFEGDSTFSIALKHRDELPKEPLSLNSQIPEDLNKVILRCMAKDPEHRFQTAQELSNALEEIGIDTQAKEATLAKSATKKTLKESSAKRIRQPILIPSIIFLAIAAIIISYLWINRGKAPDVKDTSAETKIASDPEWQNSIAVLPFRDFSPKKDQEFFCDGMTDAIIGRLHRGGDLKVISLTSVLAYKDTDRNIKKIGQELGVSTILEGSIQREGNHIRLSAQLIDVTEDAHLWTDTYDREVDSIFDVQDEISTAIAEALQVELGAEKGGKGEPAQPINIEAYEFYLKGMHFIKSKYVLSFKEEDYQAGVEMFEKALAIDPDYAQAYLGLGWAAEHHFHVTGKEEDALKVQEMAEKAYQWDPNSAFVCSVLGYATYVYQKDFDKAFELLKRGVSLNPNIGEINFLIGTCYLYHGLYEQGIQYLTRAIDLDPYYFWAPYKLAMCYMSTGELEKAAYHFDNYFDLAPVVFIFPQRPIALYMKMKNQDKVKELLAETEKINPDYWGISYGRAILHAAKGEREKALELYKNSEIYALLGMKDEAFDRLNNEIRGTAFEPYIFYYELLNNPYYDNLRDDPRFQKLLEREKMMYNQALEKYGKSNQPY